MYVFVTRSPEVLPSQLLSFSRQIASAMSYLATKGYIHRDLAARNVLLSLDETCKVFDKLALVGMFIDIGYLGKEEVSTQGHVLNTMNTKIVLPTTTTTISLLHT